MASSNAFNCRNFTLGKLSLGIMTLYCCLRPKWPKISSALLGLIILWPDSSAVIFSPCLVVNCHRRSSICCNLMMACPAARSAWRQMTWADITQHISNKTSFSGQVKAQNSTPAIAAELINRKSQSNCFDADKLMGRFDNVDKRF